MYLKCPEISRAFNFANVTFGGICAHFTIYSKGSYSFLLHGHAPLELKKIPTVATGGPLNPCKRGLNGYNTLLL